MGGPWALAYFPDGHSLAYGDNDGTIRVRPLEAGRDRAVLRGHRYRVHYLAFAPRGERLVSVSRFDGTVKLWNAVPTPEPLERRAHGGEALAVAFAPDGQTWASAGGDAVVRQWDAVTGLERRLLDAGTGAYVTTLDFTPDGKTLAAGGLDGAVRLWDWPGGSLRAVLKGHRGGVRCVRFSPDGQLLLSAGGRPGESGFGEVLLWDAGTGRQRARWTDFARVVWSATWCPRQGPGGRMLAAVYDKSVRVWDLDSGREAFRREVPDYLTAVVFSPDGKTLVTSGWSSRVRLWDPTTGKVRAILDGHTDPAVALAFSPDGKVLATGSNDSTVKLWDAATGQERFTLRGRRAMLKALAFSPDGRRLAAALKDGFVELWDAADTPVEDAVDDGVDEAWLAEVAALPPAGQVEAVVRKLRRRNPGFAGQVRPTLEGGTVTGLALCVDEVTDLTPLRALPALKELVCEGSTRGSGRLRDLAPLRGLRLTSLGCRCTRVADLQPLRGMPLKTLRADWTEVADLAPLKGMPLAVLGCKGTPVSDLSPLKGMPLRELDCSATRVSDLSPLKGLPLTLLWCYGTPVSDLSPLRGLPLRQFICMGSRVTDLSPLRGMPLRRLYCDRTTGLGPELLRAMPLRILSISSLSPAERATFRSHPTLEFLNALPVSW